MPNIDIFKDIIEAVKKTSTPTTDGTIATPPLSTAENLNAARSTFYSKCSIAAISEVPVHTIVLMTDVGQIIGLESFDHTA